MRIVVATDGIGALTSAEAGAAVAAGWDADDVTVVPMGESGGGALQALADQVGGALEPLVDGDRLITRLVSADVAGVAVGPVEADDGPIPYDGSSLPLGTALAELLHSGRATRVVVDLSGLDVHDGGAGLLAGLGATADVPLDAGVEALAGITRIDLGPCRERLRGIDLHALFPAADVGRPLLGLRGITSRRGQATGLDPARMLAVDAALESLAKVLGVADRPDLGARGGTSLAVAALGGRARTGPNLCAELGGLVDLVARADLVVTGCSAFDFLARGGGVVAEVASIAEVGLRPCVLLAGEVFVGGREMRTMGIEAAYAVRESTADLASTADVEATDLHRLAARVARSWRW